MKTKTIYLHITHHFSEVSWDGQIRQEFLPTNDEGGGNRITPSPWHPSQPHKWSFKTSQSLHIQTITWLIPLLHRGQNPEHHLGCLLRAPTQNPPPEMLSRGSGMEPQVTDAGALSIPVCSQNVNAAQAAHYITGLASLPQTW